MNPPPGPPGATIFMLSYAFPRLARACQATGLAAVILLVSCVDAPLAPTSPGHGAIRIAPTLSLQGAVAGTPQADALAAAFDRVDRFRMVIRRASNDEVVVDTVITVTPGQSS